LIDKEDTHLFTRRSLVLGGVQGCLALSLVGRLYFLQVVNGQHYKLLSDKNRIQTVLLAPERGNILDRLGRPLATNKTSYKGIIHTEHVENGERLVDHLTPLLSLDHGAGSYLLDQIKKKKNKSFVVKEDLSWEELARLELNNNDLMGLEIEKGFSRLYVQPLEMCHVLGYLSAITENDKDLEHILDIPGFKIGRSGLEKTYDSILRGKPGFKQVEVNAARRAVRTLSTVDSIKGSDITLTLDVDLHQHVYHTLQQHESACAAVMDVHTGELLACVSHPGFDANLFTKNISKNAWKTLAQDENRPLLNKMIAGGYAPGSVFKMVVALAALEAGVIDKHTSYHCPGHYDLGSHRFHCWNWRHGGHGSANVQSAIAQSCDVFFYNIASLVGVDAIAAMARRFGLGELTGIEISGEKSGLVPTKEWKKRVRKQPWTPGETINVSIGQGALITTPLQLLRMISMLVNGLKPITPHFIKKDHVKDHPPLDLSSQHMQLILDGMNDAVNKPWGTAYNSRIQQEGLEMGGKTGSTQVQRISMQARLLDEVNTIPRQFKEHALFAGYAPLAAPQYAAIVLVEHGGGGAKTAAPLAKEILKETQKIMETSKRIL
jgi:penicillin-binding protein 2